MTIKYLLLSLKTASDVVVGGEKLSDALKANLLNAAGRVGARQIGKAYGAKDLTSFEHKALHAALGGAIGALSSDNPAKGALSGAVAGALSEIIADLITTKPEEAIQQALNDSSNPNALRDFLQNYEEHVGLTTDIAQVLTAAIAAALNLDIQVANNVANNAVKNNMLPMMLAGAAALATDVAVAHFLRQIGVTLGAVAIAKIMDEAKDGPLASLTENQWKSLISLFKAQENAMDAAPDLGRQDEGFDAHARGIQVNATPIADPLPTSFVTPIADKLPTNFITPIPEDVRQIVEGFNIHDGPSMNILYKELEKIAGNIAVAPISLPGNGDNWVKLRGNQGWKNTEDGTIWKKDMLHKDHWDVSDKKGNKVKEVDFEGVQIWPNGPKNKNKSS